MLIHNETKTVSSTDSGWDTGVWTGNTTHRIHGMLQQVYVQSTTTGNNFKFKLSDLADKVIYDSEDFATNILNQRLTIPVKGIYTMSIYGPADTTEEFKILLAIRED